VIVQKFGGTSVGGPAQIRRLGEIVARSLSRHPVVVVSAVAGVTTKLFQMAESARASGEWRREFEGLAEIHRGILRELELAPALVDPLLGELEELLRGIALVRELTPRTLDRVASFGERMSARIVAAHVAHTGVSATAIDAWDAGLVTDERFGGARPVPDSEASIRSALAGRRDVPVITGYIGRTRSGEVTTLGRGGSDFSAAIFGAALGAEEIEIWTDVDGVMTADPRIVKEARHVRELSFAEAAELAFFGAKVLHPATMVPAVQKGVPIRVRNSFAPEQPGTTVVAKPSTPRGVCSIAHKEHIAVVNVVAAPMMLSFGFLARVAEIFARYEIVVDMIATTEISLALTTEPGARLEPAMRELATFAEVSVVRDLSLVSIVGEALRDSAAPLASVLALVDELGVRVEMVSYGATRNNLSLAVPGASVREVVRALHRRLFEQVPAAALPSRVS
jgi:aspartate kinase